MLYVEPNIQPSSKQLSEYQDQIFNALPQKFTLLDMQIAANKLGVPNYAVKRTPSINPTYLAPGAWTANVAKKWMSLHKVERIGDRNGDPQFKKTESLWSLL